MKQESQYSRFCSEIISGTDGNENYIEFAFEHICFFTFIDTLGRAWNTEV